MAEDRRADRPPDKADEEHAERLEHTDQWIGFGEEELAEHQPGDRAVQQEVVPFDRGADRAGDQGATQVAMMFGRGKATRGGGELSHRCSSHYKRPGTDGFLVAPHDNLTGAPAPDVLRPPTPIGVTLAQTTIADNMVRPCQMERSCSNTSALTVMPDFRRQTRHRAVCRGRYRQRWKASGTAMTRPHRSQYRTEPPGSLSERVYNVITDMSDAKERAAGAAGDRAKRS